MLNTSLTFSQRRIFGLRLLTLAALLDSVPAEKYDHSSYVSWCGTTACALGHAAARKDLFPELRLAWGATAGECSLDVIDEHDERSLDWNILGAAEGYFGPGTNARLFDLCAFGASVRSVTNLKAAARARELASEMFGTTENPIKDYLREGARLLNDVAKAMNKRIAKVAK